jgi:hypothetical protein
VGRFIDPVVTLPGGGNVVTRDVRLTDEIFRGGINWKIQWLVVRGGAVECGAARIPKTLTALAKN